MEHGSQKAARLLIVTAIVLLAPPLWPAELKFEVRHERVLKDHEGVLTIGDDGVAYEQLATGKAGRGKLESARWLYQDIQQLWVSPDKLVLVTYEDKKWLLGIDKEYEFFPRNGAKFEAAYALLKDKLDQRFVAALADPQPSALWELPAKLLGTIQGSEGVLQVSADRIVFQTDRKRQSRTWRYQDIENISTSGPFQLTLTTYERAKTHYGSMKGFNFQLKEKLDEQRYDALWRRLNQNKGLTFLSSIHEGNKP